MSLKTRLKGRYEEELKKRRASRGYKKLVAKQTLQARRRAYREQALIEAREQGKRMAKERASRPSLGRRFISATGGYIERATRPPAKPTARKTPIKRRKKRTTTTVVRRRRRTTTAKKKPKRRVVYYY